MTEAYFAPAQYNIADPQVADAQALGRLEAHVYLGRHESEQAAGTHLATEMEVTRLRGEQHVADLTEDIERYGAVVAEDPGAALWRVARTSDGGVVGSVRASRSGTTAELLDIQVDPDFHGQGTAQELLGEVFAWAEAHNPGKGISVSVDTQNARAMGFYVKEGFRQVAGTGIGGGGIVRMMRMPDEGGES